MGGDGLGAYTTTHYLARTGVAICFLCAACQSSPAFAQERTDPGSTNPRIHPAHVVNDVGYGDPGTVFSADGETLFVQKRMHVALLCCVPVWSCGERSAANGT